MQSLLSGDTFAEIIDRIKRTVPISAVNSCKLWPAVTAFNFTFVSPQYRSIFAGFVAIGWQTYLSLLNRIAEEEEAAKRQFDAALSEGKRDMDVGQGKKAEA